MGWVGRGEGGGEQQRACKNAKGAGRESVWIDSEGQAGQMAEKMKE